MKINPYLNFDGQCAEAFRFYEECLGGKIAMMLPYGESPMAGQTPEEWRNRIMHTSLIVGDQVLAGADAPPGQYRKPQGITVALDLNDASEAERVFTGLSENGEVVMPLQQTFWAQRFGMVTDRFGIGWMVTVPA